MARMTKLDDVVEELTRFDLVYDSRRSPEELLALGRTWLDTVGGGRLDVFRGVCKLLRETKARFPNLADFTTAKAEFMRSWTPPEQALPPGRPPTMTPEQIVKRKEQIKELRARLFNTMDVAPEPRPGGEQE